MKAHEGKFGSRIKKLRIERGLNQQYVAKKLRISIPALSRYETGVFEPKSLDLILDFSQLYDVSTDYLLGKSNVKKSKVDFTKLDIGLTQETFDSLTDAQKTKIRKMITTITKEK